MGLAAETWLLLAEINRFRCKIIYIQKARKSGGALAFGVCLHDAVTPLVECSGEDGGERIDYVNGGFN